MLLDDLLLNSYRERERERERERGKMNREQVARVVPNL
jgi:hypothetical protein